ncbi:MAG TPA: hypothetical protein VGQ84_05595 [Gaiellaceae bacterium]|jgi:hypothetical protein|nr:hypothetical protein [Gaiellaceae bacterium]
MLIPESGSASAAGTIVVDPEGLRGASAFLLGAAERESTLAGRIRAHPLPELPASLAGIGAELGALAAVVAAEPPILQQTAQELRVRALWAEIADKLMAGYDLEGPLLDEFKVAMASGLLLRFGEPWQDELANAYAKKLQDESHHGGVLGFFEDVGHGIADFFKGAWDAVAEPVAMLYRLTPLNSEWTRQWAQLGEGLAYGATHPLEFGKALIGIDALQERGFAYWLGNLVPAAAATVLSGGAAAAVRGGSTTSRLARAGAALERITPGARLVENADDLRRLETAAVRAGRLDYTQGFADQLRNFAGGKAWLHEGPLDRDLVLVQYFDESSSSATMKWWTSTGDANTMATIEEVRHRLALLPDWGERDAVRVARVPRGTEVEFLHGQAAEQTAHGLRYAGGAEQFRFRDFDERWVLETRTIP